MAAGSATPPVTLHIAAPPRRKFAAALMMAGVSRTPAGTATSAWIATTHIHAPAAPAGVLTDPGLRPSNCALHHTSRRCNLVRAHTSPARASLHQSGQLCPAIENPTQSARTGTLLTQYMLLQLMVASYSVHLVCVSMYYLRR